MEEAFIERVIGIQRSESSLWKKITQGGDKTHQNVNLKL